MQKPTEDYTLKWRTNDPLHHFHELPHQTFIISPIYPLFMFGKKKKEVHVAGYRVPGRYVPPHQRCMPKKKG